MEGETPGMSTTIRVIDAWAEGNGGLLSLHVTGPQGFDTEYQAVAMQIHGNNGEFVNLTRYVPADVPKDQCRALAEKWAQQDNRWMCIVFPSAAEIGEIIKANVAEEGAEGDA